MSVPPPVLNRSEVGPQFIVLRAIIEHLVCWLRCKQNARRRTLAAMAGKPIYHQLQRVVNPRITLCKIDLYKERLWRMREQAQGDLEKLL